MKIGRKELAPAPGADDPMKVLVSAMGQLALVSERLALLVERDIASDEATAQALREAVRLTGTQREDAAEWRAAVLRGENDELVDICESALVLCRSALKACVAHHQPAHLVGCTICETYKLDRRMKEIFDRVNERNETAKHRARMMINTERESEA